MDIVGATGGTEPRRERDRSVFWLVEVWLHDDVFARGCIVDMTTRSLCVKTSDTAENVMRRGELCRLKVHTDSGVFVCTGEICNIDQRGVLFEVREGSVPWLPTTNAAQDYAP